VVSSSPKRNGGHRYRRRTLFLYKPFFVKEEDLTDADALIKETQAIIALRNNGLIPQGLEQPLVEKTLEKLGVDNNVIDAQPVQPVEQVDQQVFQ